MVIEISFSKWMVIDISIGIIRLIVRNWDKTSNQNVEIRILLFYSRTHQCKNEKIMLSDKSTTNFLVQDWKMIRVFFMWRDLERVLNRRSCKIRSFQHQHKKTPICDCESCCPGCICRSIFREIRRPPGWTPPIRHNLRVSSTPNSSLVVSSRGPR